MNMQGSKRPLQSYVRDARRKKFAVEVDLNENPQEGDLTMESTSNHANAQASHPRVGTLGDMAQPIDLIQTNMLDGLPSGPLNRRLTPIDVDTLDDEVIISSPRRFTEAKNRKRRQNQSQNNGVIHLDEEVNANQVRSGRRSRSRGRDGSKKPADAYITVEQVNTFKVKKTVVEAPEEPVFSCAICMGDLVEATSTICGHIFCNKCIKTAITKCKKCPTCRKVLKPNNIHRVYLPTTN